MEKEIVLCDTNVIIELLKDNQLINRQLKQIGQTNLYISTITAAELYFGALNKKELYFIQKRINSITHIPINESISDHFESLMVKYSLSHKLSIPDAIIAATALFFNLPLFTLNTKDFKYLPDLILFKGVD